jgi:predicted nucleic acid-binding protein
VIALDLIDLLPRLSLLFDSVLLPRGVRRELYKRRRMKDRLSSHLDADGFLQPCDRYDQAVVDILLTHRRRGWTDRGETEAVIQAQTLGAMVLIDERRGQKLARQYALDCHGTIWVLERLLVLNMVGPVELRRSVHRIHEAGIRWPKAAIARLLEIAGE